MRLKAAIKRRTGVFSGTARAVRRSSRAGRICSLSLFLCLFIASVLTGGCARNQLAKDVYADELEKWTRSTQVYDGMDARLYLYATYKTPSFRKAYVDVYAGDYALDEAYRNAMMTREEDLGERYNEFFIAAFTPDVRWNDFDKRNSVWKLYLDDDTGTRLVPVSVDKVDAKDPRIREFFPYLDPWSYAYVVRFPKYSAKGLDPIPGPKTVYMKLIVTGALGKGELEWRLKVE